LVLYRAQKLIIYSGVCIYKDVLARAKLVETPGGKLEVWIPKLRSREIGKTMLEENLDIPKGSFQQGLKKFAANPKLFDLVLHFFTIDYTG
jgi:hypothetical protein